LAHFVWLDLLPPPNAQGPGQSQVSQARQVQQALELLVAWEWARQLQAGQRTGQVVVRTATVVAVEVPQDRRQMPQLRLGAVADDEAGQDWRPVIGRRRLDQA